MDVRLFHQPDGGEITLTNGTPELDSGLETAVYLSLFGGNADDDGSQATQSLQWWGNLSETDPERRYRSETQGLLHALPATTGNLRRIEAAAQRDLAWLTTEIANSVSVRVSMPGLNKIQITVAIQISDKRFEFVFASPWQLTQ